MAAVNEPEAANHGAPPHFWKLALGSVGVVYGDIGTSPLYALREALHGAARDGILGDRELATLEWVYWFNNRRLLEPIGNIPPAEAETRFYAQLEATALAA